MRSEIILPLLILNTLLNPVYSQPLNYSNETSWGTTCLSKESQSPVNLPTINNKTYTYSNDLIRIVGNELSNVSGLYFETLYDMKFWLNLTNYGYINIMKNNILYYYDVYHAQIHTPSEHFFNNKVEDMELQFVFKKNNNWLYIDGITIDPDADTQVLVIAFIFTANGSSENALIKSMNINSTKPISLLDLSSLFSSNQTFIYYSGSLTNPPCNQPADWIIFDKIQSISQSQLTNIKNWIEELYPNGNARKIQDLNGRKLYYKSSSSLNRLKLDYIYFVIYFFFLFSITF